MPVHRIPRGEVDQAVNAFEVGGEYIVSAAVDAGSFVIFTNRYGSVERDDEGRLVFVRATVQED